MFGFAYGDKENGAVFSHMTVMFANALYQRGFAEEGWKAIRTLTNQASDFDKSRIYPGIPEYFRADGRGMYNYLTGAASWLMMTVVQEMYGVKGNAGDMVITPRLCQDQFDEKGIAELYLPFAGSIVHVVIENEKIKAKAAEKGSCQIKEAVLNGTAVRHDAHSAYIHREKLEKKDGEQEIRILLG